MSGDFLKPRGVDTADLDRRKMEDGQFRNPPMYMQLGGFSSAAKGMFDKNKMTLEKSGPQAMGGRPL
jgi:hypothetical protein